MIRHSGIMTWGMKNIRDHTGPTSSRGSHKMEKPLFSRILPDILAFGVGLSITYFLNWRTTDLVWSLWLCSLVVGYLTILSAIGAGGYLGFNVVSHEGFIKEHRGKAILFGSAVGLFVLGFFSLHFCGFHAGHSVFLNGFFPIEGMPDEGFGAAFMNPPLLWLLVFKHLMAPYGIFLIPAIMAERKHIFQPIIKAVATVRDKQAKIEIASIEPSGSNAEEIGKKTKKGGQVLGDAMGRPYLNVVRMHLLIFFFGFCHALKIESFVVFAVVYSVYFFPWAEIKNLARKRTNEAPATASGLDS